MSVGWPVAHAASAASSAGLRTLMMLPEDLQDSPFFTNKKHTYKLQINLTSSWLLYTIGQPATNRLYALCHVI